MFVLDIVYVSLICLSVWTIELIFKNDTLRILFVRGSCPFSCCLTKKTLLHFSMDM